MRTASYLFSLANVCCEKCQNHLRLEDFHPDKGLTCPSCGSTLPWSQEELGFLMDQSLARPTPQVSILREDAIFRIEKKWLSRRARQVVAFSFCWNLALAGGTWFLLKNSALTLVIGTPSVTYGTLALLALVGLYLLYKAIQGMLNTTTIMIKNNKVVVGVSPISLAPLKIYNVADIKRINLWDLKREKPKFAFGVNIHLKNGKKEKICPASDVNEAAYIEKTINEFLHVEERPKVDQDAV